MYRALSSLSLAALIAAVGCNRESPKGGPGAQTPTTTTKTTKTPEGTVKTVETTPEKASDTFQVQVPRGATNVTQSERKEITISLDRGSEFKQNVSLKFDAPAGLKVVPSTTTIKSGQNEANIFVEAADNATVGRHQIKVTGVPDQGKSTSVAMDIDVKNKDK